MSFADNFIKDAFKSPLNRMVDGIASGVSAGVASAIVPQNAQLTAGGLLSSGLSINNAEQETAAKIDSAIIGSADDYTAATGKDTARASAADVSRARVPEISGQFADVAVPEKKIRNVNNGQINNVHLLTEMNHDEQPYMRMVFGNYKRPNPFKPASIETDFVAFLPLPRELVDSTSINYSAEQLGTVGDIANVIGSGGESAGTSVAAAALRSSGSIVSTAGKLMQTFGANKGGALGAVSKLAGAATQAGAPAIATVLQQALGVAPNPNPSLAFRGPTLRTFAFTWMFHPNNVAESQRLQKFIRELRKRALPSPTVSTNTALLNYPQMCQINLFPWDRDGADNVWGWGNHSFMKFKKSVVTGFNINYAPSGVPAFFEGTKYPVFAAITIQLSEIEFFTADDWTMPDGNDALADTPVGKRRGEKDLPSTEAGLVKEAYRGL